MKIFKIGHTMKMKALNKSQILLK